MITTTINNGPNSNICTIIQFFHFIFNLKVFWKIICLFTLLFSFFIYIFLNWFILASAPQRYYMIDILLVANLLVQIFLHKKLIFHFIPFWILNYYIFVILVSKLYLSNDCFNKIIFVEYRRIKLMIPKKI